MSFTHERDLTERVVVPSLAALESTTVVKSDLPFAATATSRPDLVATGQRLLLVQDSLTFKAASTALNDASVAGVVVSTPSYPDHARKMLQEANKALVVGHGKQFVIREGGIYQIDDQGIIDLEALPVSVSAICSHLTTPCAAQYHEFNITQLGYFRFKFCLFELLAHDPERYNQPRAIEKYLQEQLQELVAQGWTSIRCILSDPTSAELQDLGVRVQPEANPELGMRGPRALDRWSAELLAIRAVAEKNPQCRWQVSVPFVSKVAEYGATLDLALRLKVPKSVEFGLTLEVPSMMFELETLLSKYPVAFIAVGTSDLFSLLNGIDRSNKNLSLDPTAPANHRALLTVTDICRGHETPFFVCGEIRKDITSARELIKRGGRELIASSSVREISRINRIAAGDPLPNRLTEKV